MDKNLNLNQLKPLLYLQIYELCRVTRATKLSWEENHLIENLERFGCWMGIISLNEIHLIEIFC